MATLKDLTAAHEQFRRVLETVDEAQWSAPTPCEDWSVGTLLKHIAGGEQMTIVLLNGATAEEARNTFADVEPATVRSQYATVAEAVERAFAAPGALDQTVHHPIGDVSGSQLLGFRVGDLTLHAWDLSRAIGGDESLDPALVEAVWSDLEPISSIIGSIGVFGEGPSGTVSEEAELQLRLLDLSGRRP